MRQFCQPQSGNILRCPLAHFYSAVDNIRAFFDEAFHTLPKGVSTKRLCHLDIGVTATLS